MPNENKRIIDRMFGENNPELIPLELNQILEEELAKPEEEIDTQLIAELIDLLEPEAPSVQGKDANWEVICQKLLQPKRKIVILRRVAAIAASIVLLFTVSLTSAKAFNWTFLLKYLVPVAQTFGIVTSDYLPEETSTIEYRTEDAEDSQEIDFYSLDEMPTELGMAVAESSCVPEGYHFESGVWFQDIFVEKYSLSFSDGDTWFILEILDFADDEDLAIDFEFERQISVPRTLNIDGTDITLYHNTKGLSLFASWLVGNTHYNVNGMLSENDLSYIVHFLQSYQS